MLGKLDDLRIYNRVLSEHDVSELYAYTRAEPQPRIAGRSDGLVAHYTFDDGTADDVSGLGHHGAPENGVIFEDA